MLEILELSREISNYAICGEGNVSVRFENGFLVKSSGTDLKDLSEEDLTLCDFDGNQLDPHHKKPSIEVLFHSWIMKNFSEINYIAHTHPPNTVKILCSQSVDDFSSNRLFPDQIVRNGTKSCLVPYASPGKEILNFVIKHVSEFIEQEGYFPKLILLENHGIISASPSKKDCSASTLMCEKSANIFIGAKMLGEVKFLTKDQILEVDNCPNEIYRRGIYQ
jgi:L-fuculose-phosphate aldolase